jgi:HAD superfamily hydrolase (TIGR01509 family)
MNGKKLIVFDLDGVLIQSKDLHYEALNIALNEIDSKYVISRQDHLKTFDGLKSSEKLDMLTKDRSLPQELHSQIWNRKQEITIEQLQYIQPNLFIKKTFQELRQRGYKLACCSNAIRRSVLTMLSKLDLIEELDLIISNEDVKQGKPHPEMYWKAMSIMGVLPEETLIVEDSPAGLLAASRSRADVLRVNSPKDVNIKNIDEKLNIKKMNKPPKWQCDKLNVLIPMAGAGSRFEQAGYTFPKPLIEVRKKPMIQVVVENLNIKANYIYVVQKSHREKYNLDALLSLITPGCKIVETEGLTEGAACTALLAKEHINTDAPLFFANSDQFVEWDSNEFMYKMNETDADGGIVTFEATHPKWSFAKVDEKGLVTEVAEKKPISNIATVGYYYWKHGSDFVKYAEQMIEKDIRVNNEFYVAPCFNQAIQDGKQIRVFQAQEMWGLGDPDSLEYYLKNYK